MKAFWESLKQRWIILIIAFLLAAAAIILPLLLDKKGMENLAANVPSEVVGAALGIVITYFIVDWIVTRRERVRFHPARRHFWLQLFGYARDIIQSFAEHPRALKDWSECQRFYDRVVLLPAIHEVSVVGGVFLAEDEKLLHKAQAVEDSFNQWHREMEQLRGPSEMKTDDRLAQIEPTVRAAFEATSDLEDYLLVLLEPDIKEVDKLLNQLVKKRDL